MVLVYSWGFDSLTKYIKKNKQRGVKKMIELKQSQLNAIKKGYAEILVSNTKNYLSLQ